MRKAYAKAPRRLARVSLATVLAVVLAGGATGGLRAQAGRGSPRPELVTADAERAVKRGLDYLARTQGRDGSWRTRSVYGAYPCAMTSLAGLALLAGGNTPLEGEYAANVRRAVDYVLACANPNTGIISRMEEEQRPMYGHGFAMLFLGQVYGMEKDELRQKRIRIVLEKAVTLTGRAQSADGGWLYGPDDRGDEGSVTVTQIQGLRSVRNAGIKVPRSIIDKATRYIEKSANPDGGIRYTARDGGPSRPPITAAAVATLYNAGQYENPVAEKCLKYIKNLMDRSGRSTEVMYSGHEFYSMLYTGQAMFLSSEENWKFFFPACRDNLVQRQAGDGSWNGDGVGETYGTAIALLTLQLPYQNLPILQR